MRATIILLTLCSLPGLACAGAWPRETGTWFASVSHKWSDTRGRAGSPSTGFSTLFVEYGAAPRLTVGLDAGRGDTFGDWSALAFLRTPLDDGKGKNRLSAEIGIGGGGADGTGSYAVIRPGLSWGRGVDTRWGPGWTALDTSAELRPDTGSTIWKIDATLGIKPSDSRMVILQVQTGDYPGSDPYMRLAPSLVQKLGRGNSFIELGVTYDLTNHRQVGIKLGSWMSF